MDVSKLKVAEIKKELKDRGLNTTGNKQELLARLQEAIEEAEVIGQDDPADELAKDVDVSQAEEAVLLPTPEAKPSRKIVLNRQTPLVTEEDVPKEDAAVPASDATKSATASLTSAERLALRAKRFGVPAAPEAAEVPAKRPKEAVTEPEGEAVAATAVVVEVQPEVLRKRAERFGIIAPAAESLDIAERKKQRAERFGAAAAAAAPTSTTPVTAPAATETTGEEVESAVPAAPLNPKDVNALSLEERKKIRAQRFK